MTNPTIARMSMFAIAIVVLVGLVPSAEAGPFRAPHCEETIVNLNDGTHSCKYTWQGTEYAIIGGGKLLPIPTE